MALHPPSQSASAFALHPQCNTVVKASPTHHGLCATAVRVGHKGYEEDDKIWKMSRSFSAEALLSLGTKVSPARYTTDTSSWVVS